jgi:hypothetical protein
MLDLLSSYRLPLAADAQCSPARLSAAFSC